MHLKGRLVQRGRLTWMSPHNANDRNFLDLLTEGTLSKEEVVPDVAEEPKDIAASSSISKQWLMLKQGRPQRGRWYKYMQWMSKMSCHFLQDTRHAGDIDLEGASSSHLPQHICLLCTSQNACPGRLAHPHIEDTPVPCQCPSTFP